MGDTHRPPTSIGSVEEYFDGRAGVLKRAAATASKAAKLLKAAATAASAGDVIAIQKALGEAAAVCSLVAEDIAQGGIDEAALTSALAAPSYLEEIALHAHALGLRGLRVTEGKLAAFPFLIEPPTGLSVGLGSKKVRRIKPSAVATAIGAARDRGNIDEAKLAQAIGRACEFLARDNAFGVPLSEVYDFLTPLPGHRAQFTIDDFYAGLSRLAASGPHSYGGRTLTFSSPSTGAAKARRVIGPDGRPTLYAAVRLASSADPGY